MAKVVRSQTPPTLIAKSNPVFDNTEFSAAVWNKGLDVYVEEAVQCPCKTDDNDYLSTCENCLGTGWVFINTTEDRMILVGLNTETKFKEWSAEKLGTVSISSLRRGVLANMDRVTIQDSEVLESEVLYPREFGANYFTYTIYPILNIKEIFLFAGATNALTLLEEDVDYTFEGNKILFTLTPAPNTTVSVRYNHKLQYHVIDIPHIIRNSYMKNEDGQDELMQLPVHAVARLAHYVVDAPNFVGDNIFDNTYQTA